MSSSACFTLARSSLKSVFLMAFLDSARSLIRGKNAPDYTHQPKNLMVLYAVLLRSAVRCWACRKATAVLSIGGFDEFEQLRAITGVKAVSDDLDAQLKRDHPYFKLTHSKTTDTWSYANVCEHCGKLQGDFYLHNEPDGPFFGLGQTETTAEVIELEDILELLVHQLPEGVGVPLTEDD